jgi:hypothetical protein
MRKAHSSRRQIEQGFDGLDLDFDTTQDLVPDAGMDLDFLQFEQGFDALMESIEFELSPTALAAVYDNKTGSLSVARKARRDASQALRSLPVGQLDTNLFDEFEHEAA